MAYIAASIATGVGKEVFVIQTNPSSQNVKTSVKILVAVGKEKL